MTVLGAISAAGGAQFSESAEILRTDSTGKHVAARFSVSKLTDGEEADVPVQSGDVVVVEPSLVGAIPFALMQILNRFGAGLYLPVP
jgi:protein involved in polysaccharide export with SLBB domain